MIACDLDFDVSRFLDYFFDIDFAGAEGSLGLARSISDGSFQITLAIHAAHPLAASARGSLEQHRIADRASQISRMGEIRCRFFATGHNRDIHLLGEGPRSG